ncbi:MAG: OadG family protein [SAR324 cluster bacterium]|nr:OadG family protein [SAR324 cluster bacterium]
MIWKRTVRILFFLVMVLLWGAANSYAASELFIVPVVGLATVLATLVLLYILCALVGRYFINQDKAAAAKAAPAPVATAAPAAETKKTESLDGVSPELIAILSAAAESVLRKPVAIVRVSAARDHWWAVQGRQAHHHSRKTR